MPARMPAPGEISLAIEEWNRFGNPFRNLSVVLDYLATIKNPADLEPESIARIASQRETMIRGYQAEAQKRAQVAMKDERDLHEDQMRIDRQQIEKDRLAIIAEAKKDAAKIRDDARKEAAKEAAKLQEKLQAAQAAMR